MVSFLPSLIPSFFTSLPSYSSSFSFTSNLLSVPFASTKSFPHSLHLFSSFPSILLNSSNQYTLSLSFILSCTLYFLSSSCFLSPVVSLLSHLSFLLYFLFLSFKPCRPLLATLQISPLSLLPFLSLLLLPPSFLPSLCSGCQRFTNDSRLSVCFTAAVCIDAAAGTRMAVHTLLHFAVFNTSSAAICNSYFSLFFSALKHATQTHRHGWFLFFEK